MLLPEIPEAAVWAIYFSPVVAFLVIAALMRSRPAIEAGRLTILAIGVSWLLALWALDTSMDLDGVAIGFASHEWLSIGDLTIAFGVRLDGLTAIMLIVVTSVSLLVQIYSTGYMQGDRSYARYFAFMSLFTAAMLGLVLSSSLLQLFVHWELVGLSSYLLIGFWFQRPAAAAAAKKAFIVTRFGDVGFLLALVYIWSQTGEFDIATLNVLADNELSSTVLTWFTLGLLAGAIGKSAQFPLHIWLPDAMEGPTPVSALIHAATMVVAGVYLIARFFPTFEAAPSEITDIVAYTGGFTALLAATMGLVAVDIKRVLAYSTISQLGYMFMALGLGGYVAAIFHLFAHAFFKALLFMGAGSVNHATNTFDMRRMGGLRHTMPITFITFVIAALSLSGVFPLAGFWSKDEILLDAWRHNKLLWGVGSGVAFLTALYMFRVIFLTFFGKYRGGGEPEEEHSSSETGVQVEPHESPASMWIPLVILAVPAIVIGWVNLNSGFGEFIEGALPAELRHFQFEAEGVVLVTSIVLALAGIGVAGAIYHAGTPRPEAIRRRAGPLHTLIERKYFMDDVAETFVVRRVLLRGFGGIAEAFDTYVVDGIVNGVGRATRRIGDAARRTEAGQLQAYTSVFFVGLLIAVIALLVVSGDVLDR